MKLPYTKFGETVVTEVELYNMTEEDKPDVVLWVERSEDYYAMAHYKGKKIAIVTRDKWMRARGKGDPAA